MGGGDCFDEGDEDDSRKGQTHTMKRDYGMVEDAKSVVREESRKFEDGSPVILLAYGVGLAGIEC